MSSYSTFSQKFALSVPPRKSRSTWNFNTMYRGVSVRGRLLFPTIWPIVMGVLVSLNISRNGRRYAISQATAHSSKLCGLCRGYMWNKIISAAARIPTLFQNYFSDDEHVEKYSWAAISLWNNFEIILFHICNHGITLYHSQAAVSATTCGFVELESPQLQRIHQSFYSAETLESSWV